MENCNEMMGTGFTFKCLDSNVDHLNDFAVVVSFNNWCNKNEEKH